MEFSHQFPHIARATTGIVPGREPGRMLRIKRNSPRIVLDINHDTIYLSINNQFNKIITKSYGTRDTRSHINCFDLFWLRDMSDYRARIGRRQLSIGCTVLLTINKFGRCSCHARIIRHFGQRWSQERTERRPTQKIRVGISLFYLGFSKQILSRLHKCLAATLTVTPVNIR